MKAGKCPNCGANISVDETKDAGICEFCGTAFVTEKAIYNINNTSNNAQTIINNYYTVSSDGNIPNNNSANKEKEVSGKNPNKRPEINQVFYY